ncbi:MAG TPA: hypothetical protein VK563_22220 [Puia sp.]|nr:hypothetical protein [Puia sp.]
MRKIFIAKDDLDSKIIGRSFPQIVGSDCKPLFDENEKYNEEDKFLSIPADGYSVKISKSVKLTDSLSSFMTCHSSILSEKLIDLLMKFNTPEFKAIPIKIFRIKELVIEKRYYIAHFIGDEVLNVDFEKSTFDYYTGGAGIVLDRSILQFKDYGDFLKKGRTDRRIDMSKIKNVVMLPSLKNDLIFMNALRVVRMLVTENLRDAMLQEKITGFRFLETGYVED